MTKYEVTMKFNYVIDTDDIERTSKEIEFPLFPDLDSDNAVEFSGSIIDWEEVTE